MAQAPFIHTGNQMLKKAWGALSSVIQTDNVAKTTRWTLLGCFLQPCPSCGSLCGAQWRPPRQLRRLGPPFPAPREIPFKGRLRMPMPAGRMGNMLILSRRSIDLCGSPCSAVAPRPSSKKIKAKRKRDDPVPETDSLANDVPPAKRPTSPS